MTKYEKVMRNRILRGGVLPTGYDPYNKADVMDLLPSLTASYGIVGRIGTTLIIEHEPSGQADKKPN